MSMPEFKVFDLLMSDRKIETDKYDDTKEINVLLGKHIRMALRYYDAPILKENFKVLNLKNLRKKWKK